MRYLVTGGNGFIGSEFVRQAIGEGDEVVVIDKSITKLNKTPGLKLMPFDIAHYEALISEIREVDYIVHLAATIGVHNTMDNCSSVISNNINNTNTIMRAAATFNKPLFFASTSEVYGKNPAVPFKEDSDSVFGNPTSPRWAYAQSKALGESLASHYQKELGLKFITGRIFNTVGPKQNAEYGMVLPRIISQAMRNEPITVYGTGLQTRSFCHVSDTANAIYMLTKSDVYGHTYNIGNNNEISIMDLAKMVVSIVGSTSQISLIDYETAYGKGFEDVPRRIPDIQKIKNDIGWSPKIKLEEIIGDIIDNLH